MVDTSHMLNDSVCLTRDNFFNMQDLGYGIRRNLLTTAAFKCLIYTVKAAASCNNWEGEEANHR